MAKVLELQLQHQSFQLIFRIDFHQDWLVWSPCSPRDSQESSPQFKYQFEHHSSNTSILQLANFFMVQLSHPYMIIEKTIALTRQNFVGKVMSLLLNMLSRLVIAFLARSKCLLISWLQSPSPSAVILEPKKIKSVIVSIVSPSICFEVMGFVFWMLSFKSAFHSPLSPSSKGSLVPLHFLP